MFRMILELPEGARRILAEFVESRGGIADRHRNLLLGAIDNPVSPVAGQNLVWNFIRFDDFVEIVASLNQEEKMTFRQAILDLPRWDEIKPLDDAAQYVALEIPSDPPAAKEDGRYAQIFGTLAQETQDQIMEVCRILNEEVQQARVPVDQLVHIHSWLKIMVPPAPRSAIEIERECRDITFQVLRKVLLAQFRAIGAPV